MGEVLEVELLGLSKVIRGFGGPAIAKLFQDCCPAVADY